MHYRWSRIRCSSPRLRSSLGADHCSWHRSDLARRLGDSNIFVCTTVIKEPAIFLWNHTFDKDDVWNLANFFPVPFGGEDGCFGAVEEFAWIGAIEDGYGGAVDQIVIGTVVNENDALGRENRRRTGFDDAGVKHSGAARKNGSLRGFGPVNEVGGPGEAHLVGLVGSSAEPVHPILTVDSLGHDRAGFGPTFVPVPFVGGKDHAFAFPMNEVE